MVRVSVIDGQLVDNGCNPFWFCGLCRFSADGVDDSSAEDIDTVVLQKDAPCAGEELVGVFNRFRESCVEFLVDPLIGLCLAMGIEPVGDRLDVGDRGEGHVIVGHGKWKRFQRTEFQRGINRTHPRISDEKARKESESALW